jgi:hypothetical protein
VYAHRQLSVIQTRGYSAEDLAEVLRQVIHESLWIEGEELLRRTSLLVQVM